MHKRETTISNCNGERSNPKYSDRGFNKNDHQTSSLYCWESILKYIPKTLKIWQPFYLNGLCKEYVEKLGYDVIHEDRDFLKWEPNNWDIIIDNPPYSNKREIITRCLELNKPFILLFPQSCISSVFMRELINNYNARFLFLKPHKAHFGDCDGVFNLNHTGNPIKPTWMSFKNNYLPQVLNYENN